MRVAFVSPLPPSPTGIADYSAEVLALLRDDHEIEAFAAQDEIDTSRIGVPIHEASALSARHRERAFDVFVHQMGNGPAHDFQWDLAARFPGLLVLHDLVLHHARARIYLDSPTVRAYAADVASPTLKAEALALFERYAAELSWDSPGRGQTLLAVQRGTVGTLLPYAVPLFRLAAASSRALAAHNAYMVRALGESGQPACRITMPFERVQVPSQQVSALREQLGIRRGELAVAAFGLLTPEKRIGTFIRAFARACEWQSGLRLLLVGPVPDRVALEERLRACGLDGRAIVCGRVPFDALPTHIEAADIVVHLRYPTARETSAALLRVLAQGRATVMSDLEHLDEIPQDAVLRADVADEEGETFRAILRLATQSALRQRLGARSRAFVESSHTKTQCRADYEAALRLTAASPAPCVSAPPAHWPASD